MTGTDNIETVESGDPPATTPRRPGIFRRAVKSLLLLAGGGLVLAVVAAVLLTPQVAQFLLERALSTAPFTLRVERLQIPDLRGVVLTGVTLSDEQGVWARAPEIALRWKPRALLDGELEITSVTVPRLMLARLPEFPPQDSKGPIVIDWPRSFLAIRLDRLTVPRLELEVAAGLDSPARRVMTGKLQAAAQFRDGLLLARLDALRTDGLAERVTLRTDVNEPARRVIADLVISSPADGWIAHELARSLGVPRAPVRIAFVGSGPPERWNGVLDLAAGNVVQGRLDLVATAAEPAAGGARISDSGADYDLVLGGEMQLRPPFIATLGLPGDLAVRAGRPLVLDGHLVLHDQLLSSARLTLRDDRGLSLVASGTDPGAGLDMLVTHKGPPLMLDDLAVGPGQLRGQLFYAANRIEVRDLVIELASLSVGEVEARRVSGRGDLSLAWGRDPEAGIVRFAANGGAQDLGQGDVRLRRPAVWELDGRWDGPKRQFVLTRARLGAPGFTAVAQGSYGAAEGATAGKLELRADNLARLTDGRYAGRLSLDADGRYDAERLSLAVTGRASDLSGADWPGLAALGVLDFTGQLNRTRQGGAASVTVGSDAFVIRGEGQLDAGDRLRADLTAEPRDAAALGRVIGMPIDEKSALTVHVDGPLRSPSLRARLELPQLGARPLQYRDLVLNLDLRDVRTAPHGNFVLRGDGPLGFMRGLVRIESADNEHLAIRDILIDNPLATFTGDFELDRRTGVVSGELDGISGDFSVLERGLDVEAEGAFSLTLKMSGRGTAAAPRQLMALSIKGRNMATVLADREAVTADSLDARMRVITDGGLMSMTALASARGQLRLVGYRSSGLSLDDLAFALSDRRGQAESETATGAGELGWTLKLAGDYYGPLSLDGAGSLQLGDQDTTVVVKRLAGRLIDRPLSLDAPATYVSTASGDRIGPLSLHYGKGQLAFDYETTAESLRADFTADGVNIAIIPLVMGLPPFDGALTGKATLALGDAAPRGRADFTLDVANADLRNVPGFTLGLTADITGAAGESSARLGIAGNVRGRGLVGTIRGDVPLRITGAGAADAARPSLAVDRAAPLGAGFTWNGPMQSLLAFLPPMDDVLEGRLRANIALAGSLDDPRLSGRVRFDNGHYEQLGFGTVLENLDVALRLDGNAITLTSLVADDGEGGTVRARGGFTLDRDWLPVGEIAATLKSARLVNMNGVRAELSGDVIYRRDSEAALLKGDLRVDRVEAGLDERLPREITTLKVREINKPGRADQAPVVPEAPKIAALSAFDLKVTAPRRLFVRGRGLDSEWSGDLTVGGAAENPDLRGTVELVRGVFSFAGKDFKLTSGSLRFDGGGRIDPVMNVKAEYQSVDITARLTLTGPLSRPELALSSTPTLPQDEILARVLFGTSVQKLSALEAVQLASAVSSLASGGGFDVFGKARGILGLDRLSVGANGAEGAGTAVTGGKYLTRDIYLEVTTDTSSGESRAVVRYDITRKLQIEAGVGASDDSTIGVRWKEDY